jgi:hypothetical protein
LEPLEDVAGFVFVADQQPGHARTATDLTTDKSLDNGILAIRALVNDHQRMIPRRLRGNLSLRDNHATLESLHDSLKAISQ